MFISFFIGWNAILGDDVLSIFIGWIFLVALSMAFGYLLLLVVGALLWVQQGFDKATKIRTTRLLFRAMLFSVISAVVFVFALYTRYDVVALMDQSEDGYRYLLWDRWTGEMSMEYGDLKPNLRKFRRAWSASTAS